MVSGTKLGLAEYYASMPTTEHMDSRVVSYQSLTTEAQVQSWPILVESVADKVTM